MLFSVDTGLYLERGRKRSKGEQGDAESSRTYDRFVEGVRSGKIRQTNQVLFFMISLTVCHIIEEGEKEEEVG